MQRNNESETLWKMRKKNLLNIWRDIQKETSTQIVKTYDVLKTQKNKNAKPR
jgi:hypothetical protein